MSWTKKLSNYHYLVILIEVAIVLLLLLLFPRNLQGQDRIVIHGIVYETDSRMPLSGTHILLDGTSYGTISGPDGYFRLSVSDLPAILRLSHVGYEERLFSVEDIRRNDTLMLGMRFTAEMLDGITITDKKVETIFRDESYSVLDFEFHENGLMLLVFRNQLKKSELILLSFMNDTLAVLHELPGRAISLHRDCREFIHYCEQDTAYQVYFDGRSLKLLYPISMDLFRPVAKTFVAFIHGYYYFAVSRMYQQIIDYIRYDSVSESYASFRRIADKKMLQVLKDNPMHHRMLIDPFSDEQEFDILLAGGNGSAEDEMKMRQYERDISIESHYLRTIVYTPLYAPLFENNDGLIIFNHPQSTIEFLDYYGKIQYATSIHYHESDDWDEQILKDEIADEYYVVYRHSNRLSLHLIDISNGQLGFPNILSYPFVKKVLVRNGYAYFTYRTPGSDERTMLFRQKLNEEENRTATSNRD